MESLRVRAIAVKAVSGAGGAPQAAAVQAASFLATPAK